MITRHLETLYCDDIRREDSGKIIYVGVYSDALWVKSFPFILQKICVAAKAVTPLSKPFSSLNLKIYKDDELLQELSVSDDQLPPAPNTEEMLESELKELAQVAQFNVIMSPLVLEGPFVLKARLETEDGELEGLDLRVDHLPLNHPAIQSDDASVEQTV